MNLTDIPIYDHHAHALLHERLWKSEPIEQYYTEASDPVILERFVKDNLYFRRSVRDLATYYGCAATPEAVREARQATSYPQLIQAMFRDTGISTLLIDDGIWPERLWSVQESADHLPCRVRRVLRLESEAVHFIRSHDSARAWLSEFTSHLRRVAPTLAGLKSIAAYRTGLDITKPEIQVVEAAYSQLKRRADEGVLPRLNDKALVDRLIWASLEVARECALPVQFHTGYGDPDLDLRLADPLHLRGVLEAPELAGLNVVMLHCYPYVRQAGYLASVYSGAYLDLGLTIPYTSVNAMRTSAHEALHLAPVSKVLFSTDAQRTPEMFWLAAKWGREILSQVLQQTVEDGDLSGQEAVWAAQRILHDNAFELYEAH